MCKNGKDKCVAAPSVHAHLANGSSLGSCEAQSSGRIELSTIENVFEKTVLKTYPNPIQAASRVVIHASKSERYTLSIVDMKGALVKVIARGELKANRSITHDLRASNYAKGTYLIKLVTDTEVLIERIVVQ